MIKFRVWDKEENKMWNVETLYIEDEWVKVNDGSIYEVTKDLTSNYYLMQSTGLKDKNGVEIYEGDIVKNVYDEIYLVKWLDAGFYLEERYNGGFDYHELHLDNTDCEFEVIGNVFEDKNLLSED